MTEEDKRQKAQEIQDLFNKIDDILQYVAGHINESNLQISDQVDPGKKLPVPSDKTDNMTPDEKLKEQLSYLHEVQDKIRMQLALLVGLQNCSESLRDVVFESEEELHTGLLPVFNFNKEYMQYAGEKINEILRSMPPESFPGLLSPSQRGKLALWIDSVHIFSKAKLGDMRKLAEIELSPIQKASLKRWWHLDASEQGILRLRTSKILVFESVRAVLNDLKKASRYVDLYLSQYLIRIWIKRLDLFANQESPSQSTFRAGLVSEASDFVNRYIKDAHKQVETYSWEKKNIYSIIESFFSHAKQVANNDHEKFDREILPIIQYIFSRLQIIAKKIPYCYSSTHSARMRGNVAYESAILAENLSYLYLKSQDWPTKIEALRTQTYRLFIQQNREKAPSSEDFSATYADLMNELTSTLN